MILRCREAANDAKGFDVADILEVESLHGPVRKFSPQMMRRRVSRPSKMEGDQA